MTTIEALIKSESKTVIPHCFFELCGGKYSTAAILNQIVYWFGTSKRTGKTRITPDENGERWLAKAAKDWYGECYVKLRTAQRAIKQLKELGVIETRIKKWAGVPVTYIRLLEIELARVLNSIQEAKNFNISTALDVKTERSRSFKEEATLCQSPLRQDDIVDYDKMADSTTTPCQSPLRQNARVLYKDTLTTNNNYNNSHSHAKPTEFQKFIKGLSPEEKERFKVFVVEKTKSFPNKIVDIWTWLSKEDATGTPRYVDYAKQWKSMLAQSVYSESVVPVAVDDLDNANQAKTLIDRLVLDWGEGEVKRLIKQESGGWMYFHLNDDSHPVEILESLSSNQIWALAQREIS